MYPLFKKKILNTLNTLLKKISKTVVYKNQGGL